MGLVSLLAVMLLPILYPNRHLNPLRHFPVSVFRLTVVSSIQHRPTAERIGDNERAVKIRLEEILFLFGFFFSFLYSPLRYPAVAIQPVDCRSNHDRIPAGTAGMVLLSCSFLL